MTDWYSRAREADGRTDDEIVAQEITPAHHVDRITFGAGDILTRAAVIELAKRGIPDVHHERAIDDFMLRIMDAVTCCDDDDGPTEAHDIEGVERAITAGTAMVGYEHPITRPLTLDATTQRIRPVNDDELAELQVRATPVRSGVDTGDESEDHTPIESTIDSDRVGE